MWPFDYFKKKKEERLQKIEEARKQKIAEQKRIYNERKIYIDSIVQKYDIEESIKRREYSNKVSEKNETKNKTCPKCGGIDIIQVFHRPKGEIHGNIEHSSYHCGGLFSSYSSSSSSGSLNGHLDTLQVNKCKNCNHEWEYLNENVHIHYDEYYFNKCDFHQDVPAFINRVVSLLHDIEEFDSTRIDCPYSCVDEMIEDKIKNMHYNEHIHELDYEVLFYYAFNSQHHIIFDEEVFDECDYRDRNIIRYTGSFLPKCEDILINKFHFKKHFN